VRDFKNGLTYYGLVEAYSEDEFNREMILSDVTVYDLDTGEVLYDIEKRYLGKKEEDIIIEIPN